VGCTYIGYVIFSNYGIWAISNIRFMRRHRCSYRI
jgi:hypothetical protein